MKMPSKLTKKQKKEKRNDTLKQRYNLYRLQGYDSYTARIMSQRSPANAKKVTSSYVEKRKQVEKEDREKKYLVYRKLGYDSKTARALSSRSLDVSHLEISKKTGLLKRNKRTKQYIQEDMKAWQRAKVIDQYNDKVKDINVSKMDTVLTLHGLLTHDKRYKGENGKIISIIKNENNLTTDQAYYFFYLMTQNNFTYKEAKAQLLTDKSFEEYVSKGKRGKLS
jgi:hypothetical protein